MTHSAGATVRALETGSESQFDAVFDELAREIHQFQLKENEPYRTFCRQRSGRGSVRSWREISAVPQAVFKKCAVRSFPAEKVAKQFRTSGTTGYGYGTHYFRSLFLYESSILRTWDYLGLPILPQLMLVPPPNDAPYSSLSHMMATLHARAAEEEQHWFVSAQCGLNFEHLCSYLLRAVESDRPVLLLGTALAFLHFFERLGRKCFVLPAGSAALETGGYKGSGRMLSKAALYISFADHLGLAADSVINEYGMTELSSQFYTRGIGNVHRGPPWARAFVIDPETGDEVMIGETGILRIVDLANLGSVIAVQTQDLAVRRAEGFELLGRDPTALPRGCSRSADEHLRTSRRK